MVPSGPDCLTKILPSWREITPNTTLSPKPVPCPGGLVVKKGSNTLVRYSGAMPLPLSPTSAQRMPSSSR